VKFCFIQDHRKIWPARTICRVLQVSASGFYAWRKRAPSARAQRQAQLTEKIRKIHQEHQKVYGSPRVHGVLLADGETVSRNTVAKLMRKQRIRAEIRKKFIPRTTDSNHTQPVAENKLDRNFQASAPNQKWVADITYIRVGKDQWLYLAAVLDCFSRKIVGWSMAEHLETDLAADALKMALLREEVAAGELIHHSDRGVQYASDDYQELLLEHGIQSSMSRRGDCYDNAMMESFWATLKCECVYRQGYGSIEQARQSIFEYIEVFYNRKRLHSALGYMSPESFEAAA
jgi:transposase InsO family protein